MEATNDPILPSSRHVCSSPLGRHRNATLARRMRAGDARAREELIAMHVPFARALALRYRGGVEQTDDLIQVAVVGLIKAVDRWDPERGAALSTFAMPTILGELRRHFRDVAWAIRPPRSLQQLARSTEQARSALHAELGRPPTVAELAQRLGCREEAVSEAARVRTLRVLGSIDLPEHEDGEGAPAGEHIPCIDAELERAEARAMIEPLVQRLDARAREILRLRYHEDLTQAAIATRLGASPIHISRLLRRALDQLHALAVASAAA